MRTQVSIAEYPPQVMRYTRRFLRFFIRSDIAPMIRQVTTSDIRSKAIHTVVGVIPKMLPKKDFIQLPQM